MPSALAVFACRPNSHPFQERHVYLDEPVKIGRSVARCRPAQNNATFDCKVLSRNHALVWFDHKTGKVREDDNDKLILLLQFPLRIDFPPGFLHFQQTSLYDSLVNHILTVCHLKMNPSHI